MIITLSFIVQVYDILLRIQYGKDDDQVGVSRLIGNRSFSKAFPLHDVCNYQESIYVVVVVRVAL